MRLGRDRRRSISRSARGAADGTQPCCPDGAQSGRASSGTDGAQPRRSGCANGAQPSNGERIATSAPSAPSRRIRGDNGAQPSAGEGVAASAHSRRVRYRGFRGNCSSLRLAHCRRLWRGRGCTRWGRCLSLRCCWSLWRGRLRLRLRQQRRCTRRRRRRRRCWLCYRRGGRRHDYGRCRCRSLWSCCRGDDELLLLLLLLRRRRRSARHRRRR